MSSIFDDLFSQHAMPLLMDYFGDQDTVTYTVNATVVTGITAIIGHVEVVETEDSVGSIRKIYRRALHFTRDEASKWKGIDNPQFKGEFQIKGATWKLTDRDSITIEGISEQMVTVNVERKTPVHKGQRNLREFS